MTIHRDVLRKTYYSNRQIIAPLKISGYATLPDDSCNENRVEIFHQVHCKSFYFSVENHNSFQCDLCIGFMGKTNDHSKNMLISCGHKLLLNFITLSVCFIHTFLFQGSSQNILGN